MPGEIDTWVVIADGARARIFATGGTAADLSLVKKLESDRARELTSGLGVERPGRTHASAMTARHAMAPRVDWHRQAEDDFLAALASELAGAHAKGVYAHVVIVAPPRALGVLRKAMDAKVAKCVVAELAKDLTGISAYELPGHLAAVLHA